MGCRDAPTENGLGSTNRFVEGGWVPSTLLVPYQKQPPSIHRDLESTGQAPMRAEQRARRWQKWWLDGDGFCCC